MSGRAEKKKVSGKRSYLTLLFGVFRLHRFADLTANKRSPRIEVSAMLTVLSQFKKISPLWKPEI